jgi:hypothetical protein
MWPTWRQHRAQVLATAGFLALLGVFLLVHGHGTASLRTGVADDRLTQVLGARLRNVYTHLSWLPLVPLAIGLFWGAPLLARELARGTHRLAWTQSVPRRRWLAVKLAVLGGAVTGAGLVLGAMVTAWLGTFEGPDYADRFSDPAMFGGTGVAAGAWWLFAFMPGTAAGGVLRRLLPALAVTTAVFVLAMFAIFQARPDYAEPVRSVVDGTVGGGTYVTGSGYRMYVYYQPADRYWRFQWTETAILLLAAVLLAGPVAFRVARRAV